MDALSSTNTKSKQGTNNPEILDENSIYYSDDENKLDSESFNNSGKNIDGGDDDHKLLNRKVKNIQIWTKEEDKILLETAKENEFKNWKKISERLEGRTAIQCSARYKRIRPGIIKGAWSQEEDEKLKNFIKRFGKNWSLISKYMPTRSGKQIRDRYLNTLDPTLLREKFSQEEDNKIIELYKKYGSSWSIIAKEFHGRTGDMIKNRFYSSLKKVIFEGANNLQNSQSNNNNSKNSNEYDENSKILSDKNFNLKEDISYIDDSEKKLKPDQQNTYPKKSYKPRKTRDKKTIYNKKEKTKHDISTKNKESDMNINNSDIYNILNKFPEDNNNKVSNSREANTNFLSEKNNDKIINKLIINNQVNNNNQFLNTKLILNNDQNTPIHNSDVTDNTSSNLLNTSSLLNCLNIQISKHNDECLNKSQFGNNSSLLNNICANENLTVLNQLAKELLLTTRTNKNLMTNQDDISNMNNNNNNIMNSSNQEKVNSVASNSVNEALSCDENGCKINKENNKSQENLQVQNLKFLENLNTNLSQNILRNDSNAELLNVLQANSNNNFLDINNVSNILLENQLNHSNTTNNHSNNNNTSNNNFSTLINYVNNINTKGNNQNVESNSEQNLSNENTNINLQNLMQNNNTNFTNLTDGLLDYQMNFLINCLLESNYSRITYCRDELENQLNILKQLLEFTYIKLKLCKKSNENINNLNNNNFNSNNMINSISDIYNPTDSQKNN